VQCGEGANRPSSFLVLCARLLGFLVNGPRETASRRGPRASGDRLAAPGLARSLWHPSNSAAQILRERYARGEIAEDEYRERLGALA
jgi:hypothetical protein